MAYRAEIEIGVRGSSRLKELQDRITRLGRSIDDVSVKTLINRKAVQSVESYTQALSKASNNLREVTIQLDAAGRASGNYAEAISQYVTALGKSNAAQKLQNDLIADEIELRRKQKLAAAGIVETAQAYAKPIGPARSPLQGQTSQVEERIRRTLQQRADENNLQQALLRLEQKTTAELNRQLEAQESMIRGKREVLDLVDQTARKSRLLAGGSAAGFQGPLAGAGAMGFPVALPTLREEQKGLEAAAQKQRIIERTLKTRRQLSGLAANLQRLETGSVVAIADAAREQAELTDLKRQALEITERELRISRQGALTAGRFSPVEGAENIPGSPKFLAAQRKRRRERASGVALGAGFPLLFGGGPGAVLGGAAGGLVGGPAGFAAQIALSAIGQQIDTFVAEVAKTGVALTSASGTFELVKEKSLFSSEAVKKQAYELEELGKVQELATLLTTDLAKQIGGDGVENLQKAGEETKEFTRLVNLLFTQLSSFVAGPLAAFLDLINKALGTVTTNIQFGAFKKSLTGEDAKKFATIESEVFAGVNFKTLGAARRSSLNKEVLKRAQAAGIAPEVTAQTTFEDTQTIRPPKGRTGRSPGEREAERVAKVLIQQRAVTLEIQRQSTFSAKIAAAEAAKDPLLVRRLKGEQELTELGVRTAKALELEKNSAAQLAIARAAQAKADLIRQETVQDIAAIEQKRREDFQNTIRDLDYELLIKQAVTEEDRERLRIEAEIARLRGQNIYSEQQLQEIQERKQKLAAPVRGADLIRQEAGKVRDELNTLTDIGTQVVNAASAIGDAFSNSFKGIISGAMTAQEALASFFQNIADYFLDMAAQIIAKMIQMAILNAVVGLLPGSGGGGSKDGFSGDTLAQFNASAAQYRANGGPVSAGSPYVVGEKGPELFVPGKSGTIVPNSSLGGANVVVNVDASGSSAQGNQTDASALGRAIGAAVQAELVKQKRPGGLLA